MNKWMIAAMTAVVAGGALAHEQPIWADSVTVKGDLRYRYETIDEQGAETRQRDRVRARLAVEAKANNAVKVGVGLSTTEKGDPVSSNQTLTDEFTRKGIYLDLAYFDWALVAEQLSVVGGKMKNPLINAGNLIWDGDVNPEGLAAKGACTVGPVELMANGAYFWVKEYNPDAKNAADGDIKLFVGQGAAQIKFVDEVKLTVGGSYYTFENLQGALAKDVNYVGEEKAFGNSTRKVASGDGATTNVVYKNEYNLIEGFAKLSLWVGLPVELVGQYVVNQDADDFDTGYLAGITIGKAKNPKTFEVGYNYYELEKDAVVGFMTDSDRHGGGTDGRGHVFSARYQIMKNLQIGATYFLTEKTISDDAKTKDYDRMQLDLVASF